MVDTYRILLAGPAKEHPFPVQMTTVLNIPQPTKPAQILVDPAAINFPKGQTITPWKTFAEMAISMDCQLGKPQPP